MCGILGVVQTNQAAGRLDSELLIQMRDTMRHRGPDDAGAYISPDRRVALAHRRLSIVDLTSAAAQPMANDDRTVWIVFNGEIYNHMEIRRELEAKGRRFRSSHSDTETLIRAYEEWGEDLLPRLRGMFAFAVWDEKRRRTWLVRDRLGVKPLYYAWKDGTFLFASEIKSILAYGDMPRRMHERAFYDFLTFLVAPAPQTLFDGIQKLPAGHSLTLDASGATTIKRYWNPFSGGAGILERTESEWTERIREGLRDSIRHRMMSDVNFGVFLSGGIDSSTNVALMAELMDRPVETFSIGFEDGEEFNELNYARMIADRYKTNHHEVIINKDDLVRFLPQLVHHQDEPIVDPVCVPVYFVSKLAKDNGTTVCQVGEGADELFCGYPYWGQVLDAAPWNRRYQRIPSAIRRLIYAPMNAMLRRPDRGMRRLDVVRRATAGEPLFWGGAEAYQETMKQRFLSESYLRRLNGFTSAETIAAFRRDFENDAPPGADELHWMSYLDLRFRLPELLLMRVDKMTMATSLEARVPFLDHEFVSMAMSIPQSVKYKDGTLKYILKKAVEPILPREIIYRRKQGFGVPVARWFQEKLKDWSDEKILAFAKRTDYFDVPVMREFLRSSNTKSSWFLLNFVLWHETWIEQKTLDLPV